MARLKPRFSPDRETFEIVMPSEPELTDQVDHLIEQIIAKIGYTQAMRDDIAVAVNEVVKNAILHGNKCDEQKPVKITCTCKPEEFRICVCDQGDGFNPAEVPDPLDPKNLLKETGRGLLILRSLMDEMLIDIDSEGTKVTLVKYRRQK